VREGDHKILRGVPGVFLTLLFLISTTISRAQAPLPENGELVFARLANGQPGGEGVYAISPEGTGERPLFLFDDLGLPYDVYEAGGVRCPALSPDGAQVVFNSADAETNTRYLAVVNVDGSNLRRILEIPDDPQRQSNINFPTWTPDGQRISYGFTEADAENRVTANGIRVIDPTSGDITTLLNDLTLTYDGGAPNTLDGLTPYRQALFHQWSPDARQLAVASFADLIYVLNADGSSPRPLELSVWAANAVDWSPDGAWVVGGGQFRLSLFSPDGVTQTELAPPDRTGSTYDSVAWSPDGREIAFITYTADIINGDYTYWYTLATMNVETGEIREVLRLPNTGQYEYPHAIACVNWRTAGG